MHVYIFILARTLPARERTSSLHTPPRSTSTLQRYFHGYQRLSRVALCRHGLKCPPRGPRAPLDLHRELKHPLGNPWMGHSLLQVPCPRTLDPAGLCPGSKRDAVYNTIGSAQLLMPQKWVFQPKTRVYHLGWGCASLQPTLGTLPPPPKTTPSAAPADAAPEAGLVTKSTTIKGPIINEPSLNCTGSCSSPSCMSSNPHRPPRQGDAGPSPRVIFAIYP